jgi:transcription elongation factor GreA
MEQKILLTQEKYDEIVLELQERKTKIRKDISDRLITAKEMGDLSENAEYHTARDEQGKNESRITQIMEMMRLADIVVKTQSDTVGIMSTVEFQKKDDDIVRKFMLVGPHEADMKEGKISIDSPIGETLMGKKAGDSFTLETKRGVVTYYLISVS